MTRAKVRAAAKGLKLAGEDEAMGGGTDGGGTDGGGGMEGPSSRMDLEHEIKHEVEREIKQEIKEEDEGEEEGELKAAAARGEEEPGEIASRSGKVDSRSAGAQTGSFKREGSFVDEMLDDGEIREIDEEIEGDARCARARIKSDEADEAEGAPTKARSAPPKYGKAERASAGAAHDGASHDPSTAAAAAESNTGGAWLHRVRAALDSGAHQHAHAHHDALPSTVEPPACTCSPRRPAACTCSPRRPPRVPTGLWGRVPGRVPRAARDGGGVRRRALPRR